MTITTKNKKAWKMAHNLRLKKAWVLYNFQRIQLNGFDFEGGIIPKGIMSPYYRGHYHQQFGLRQMSCWQMSSSMSDSGFAEERFSV